jgi:hypothetical protein
LTKLNKNGTTINMSEGQEEYSQSPERELTPEQTKQAEHILAVTQVLEAAIDPDREVAAGNRYVPDPLDSKPEFTKPKVDKLFAYYEEVTGIPRREKEQAVEDELATMDLLKGEGRSKWSGDQESGVGVKHASLEDLRRRAELHQRTADFTNRERDSIINAVTSGRELPESPPINVHPIASTTSHRY